jgi:hypothetical protein
MLPDKQFGFIPGRSTLHAISNLLRNIEDALRWPKGKLYAIFIDYTKAFDLLGRGKICTSQCGTMKFSILTDLQRTNSF